MEPSEKIKIITEIADKLSENEWTIIDLTLRKFGIPNTEQWSGSRKDYVLCMIEDTDDDQLKGLARHLNVKLNEVNYQHHSPASIKALIQDIETQKALMINVSTGGQRIQQVNDEYKKRREEITSKILTLKIEDPNLFSDLWAWYGKWSDGSLPSYQSRRIYISELYQPLLDGIFRLSARKYESTLIIEPTGWARVDRIVDKIIQALPRAKNEEDFQSIGLLCRETIISLAQAVYIPDLHPPLDNVMPSETDAKRMLESYVAAQLPGSSNEELRKYVKDSYQLAVTLQHKRNASFRESALCVEATRSLVNTIAIIAGRRDS
jgi:hypothetical protein